MKLRTPSIPSFLIVSQVRVKVKLCQPHLWGHPPVTVVDRVTFMMLSHPSAVRAPRLSVNLLAKLWCDTGLCISFNVPDSFSKEEWESFRLPQCSPMHAL
jgi:hypothetical protein